jgi:hypothetical protein
LNSLARLFSAFGDRWEHERLGDPLQGTGRGERTMPVAEFLEARCVRHERHEEFAGFDKDDFDPTTSSSFRSL